LPNCRISHSPRT